MHRDFKPENVMLTRAGRVVVMDFGLAKSRSELESRSVAGTPAYMSPEQSRGESVDARSDVFSAGVVLAEMLTSGPRDAIWQLVRETPPQVPEGPWGPVLRQALSPDRETRQPTARALARALDEVTHRLPGFEDKHPYPGLASFTQEEAEYFFGREVEVEAVWKKLKRPRLLALIGPSGAGKSSFLRAGLLPTLATGLAGGSVDTGTPSVLGSSRDVIAHIRGRHAGDPVVPTLRRAGDGSVSLRGVAPEKRARTGDRGPVRGAFYVEPSGGAGGVRYLIREARP